MSRKFFTVALAALLGVALATPAAAAVESVRVGGDVTIRGIYRDNLDFVDSGPAVSSSGAWLMSTARVWVGAEMTEGISALVRILNEREWDEESSINTAVVLDLAQIGIEDLFVPGLSATLGRQELQLGRGFVVGDRNPMGWGFVGVGLQGAPDLTARKAFDALRFDYEVGTAPVDITLFAAKISEGPSVWVNDDIDLAGLNVAYAVPAGNAVVEGYLLSAKDRGAGLDIWTLGAGLDHEWLTVPGLAWDAELAYQFGKATPTVDQAAWAGNIDLNFSIANPWEPKVGAAYALYSGPDAAPVKNKEWAPLFPADQASRVGSLWQAAAIQNGLDVWTNISAFKLYGSFSPAERHTVSLAVFPGHRINKAPAGVSKDLGWGLDACYTLQYSEDLTMSLELGYIRAGDGARDQLGIPAASFDKTAYQVIGKVGVAF